MIFAEVSFRVRHGAPPQVRSLRKLRVNLYRRTPRLTYTLFANYSASSGVTARSPQKGLKTGVKWLRVGGRYVAPVQLLCSNACNFAAGQILSLVWYTKAVHLVSCRVLVSDSMPALLPRQLHAPTPTVDTTGNDIAAVQHETICHA